MPPVGFESTISAGERPQTYALERAATGTGTKQYYRLHKIEELQTNSKIQNIRDLYSGFNEFKKGYQPMTNLAKDENGDLVRLPQYFSWVVEIFLSAIECTWG
jgi:hypothetical protein